MPWWDRNNPNWEASEIITVGLDLAKNVFQVHGADSKGNAVLRKKLRRAQVIEFFAKLPPSLVAMEACGGAFLGAGTVQARSRHQAYPARLCEALRQAAKK